MSQPTFSPENIALYPIFHREKKSVDVFNSIGKQYTFALKKSEFKSIHLNNNMCQP